MDDDGNYTEILTKKRVLDCLETPLNEDVILEFAPIDLENGEFLAFGDLSDTGMLQMISQAETGGVPDGNFMGQIFLPTVRYLSGSLDMDIGYKGTIGDGKPATAISLNFSTKNIDINGRFTLIAALTPADADDTRIEWLVESGSDIVSLEPLVDQQCRVTGLA